MFSRSLRLAALALILLAWPSACGGKSSAKTTTKTTTTRSVISEAAKPAFKASLKGASHKPVVNEKWALTVTASDLSGKPVAATLRLNVLTHGYGTYPADKGKPRRFVGRHREYLDWPIAAVGHPLTLQAIVTAKGQTQKLNWDVDVVRK